MKIQEYAVIGFIHFACTFVLGLIIFAFFPENMPLGSCLAVSMGVGVGRFCIELIKGEKLFDKTVAHFKTR